MVGHAPRSVISWHLGEYLHVRRGHVGVGTPKGGDTAIQIVGHGQLFAGGSSVELHQWGSGLVINGFSSAYRR